MLMHLQIDSTKTHIPISLNCAFLFFPVCMQYRPETGTYSHHMGCKYSGAKAAWLKLEKRMDFITGYVGTDNGSGNISWAELYSTEAAYIEDSQYNVGLAVCPSYHYQMEAIFEDYSVESYFFPSAAPSISSAPSAFCKWF